MVRKTLHSAASTSPFLNGLVHLLTYFRELKCKRETWYASPPLHVIHTIHIMENAISHLNAVLGFNTSVLDAPTTRRHYINNAGSWGPRYVPPKIVERKVKLKTNEFSDTQMKMLALVKKSKEPITSLKISKKMKCCQNHASLTMAKFFKKCMVDRKKVSSGRHRWYEYFIKQEKQDGA